jgi:hypothetical protein
MTSLAGEMAAEPGKAGARGAVGRSLTSPQTLG